MNPEKKPNVAFKAGQLHPKYQVTFTHQQSYFLSDCADQQEEGVLNIMNRKRMMKAGFVRIMRGWFDKSSKGSRFERLSDGPPTDDPKRPDIDILTGYECSVRLDSQDRAVFMGDLAFKIVSSKTLWGILNDLRKRFPDVSIFHREAEQMFHGKYIVLEYNKKNLRIEKLDWAQTERSTFDTSDGGKISYADYRKQVFNVASPKQEFCVIRDRLGHGYLPQHARMTFRTDMVPDQFRQKLHKMTNPWISKRLQRINQLVGRINESADDQNSTEMFRINPKGIVVNAAEFYPVHLRFQGKGKVEKATNLDIKKVWRNSGGFLGDVIPIKQWAILHGPRDQRAAQDLANNWRGYLSKRGLDRTGKFSQPELRCIENPKDFASYKKYLKRGDQFVVGILPQDMFGSQMKIHLTRACQFSAVSQAGVLFQGVTTGVCYNRSACFGVFENMNVKIGNVLYEANPNLPNGDKLIDWNNTWVAGIDVAHNGRKKPSVACLSISRRPFEGSLKSWTHSCHLSNPLTEVIGFEQMVQLVYSSLMEALEKQKKDKGSLPKVLWFFRDGVSEGQLRELYTKEVNGVERAIAEVRKTIKQKDWKPKIMFVVSQKSVLDRFGVAPSQPNGRVENPRNPCLVYDGILSKGVWDAIMLLNSNEKNRPQRYVFLKDGLGLAKNGGAMDAYQFIFSLTWTYAFSVPFPMGNCSQPAPIKYAKHYAELYAQLLLSKDRTVKDVQTYPNINRPHLVIGPKVDLQIAPPSGQSS